jgi:hypothetical protein
MARRRPASVSYGAPPGANNNSGNSGTGFKLAIAGAIFAIGIAVGVALSTLNPTQQTVDAIRLDALAPSRDFCNNYGASAMVVSSRVFITLNPYDVYVSRIDSDPGCVVLPNNWNELLRRGAITEADIRECKNRMNTFGFTGNLGKDSIVDCVYESKNAQEQLTKGYERQDAEQNQPRSQ